MIVLVWSAGGAMTPEMGDEDVSMLCRISVWMSDILLWLLWFNRRVSFAEVGAGTTREHLGRPSGWCEKFAERG
jgi:hypothetical protein